MAILKTGTERFFTSYDEAKDLIKEIEKTATYTEVSKNAMLTGEVVNCPIMPECHETAPVPGIKAETSFPGLEKVHTFKIGKELDSEMVEAMQESKLVLGVPEQDEMGRKFEPKPLAANAVASLVAQAIGGKSSVLCQTEDKTSSKLMAATVKAAIINECLSLRKDTCKVYQADGMIRYVAGNNYTYLPIGDLLDTLERELKVEFPATKTMNALVSHEYVQFTFELNNKAYDKAIEDVLAEVGIGGDWRLGLVFCSSNTGNSGANLIPVLCGEKGASLIIEEPLRMEHTGNASMEKFVQNINKICALAKATPDRLQDLTDVVINHPVEAFKNASVRAGLPIVCYSEQAELFEATYGQSATMLDLYIELSNSVAAYAEKSDMSTARRMKVMSSLSRLFLDKENFKTIDIDVDMSVYANNSSVA